MKAKTQIAALYGVLAAAATGVVLCFPWPATERGSCILQTWLGSAELLSPAEYIVPYGLIWWTSWAALLLSAATLRQARRK